MATGDADENKLPFEDNFYFRGSFLLKLWVPTEQVGLIIGKQGKMIKKISKESGAMVSPEPENPDSAWALVTVKGKPLSVFRAYKDIDNLVEEIDDCVAEFSIPKPKHALVIGKDGRTIRRISADTNVRIFVPGVDEAQDNVIQLEGEVMNVAKAFRDICAEVYRRPTLSRDDNWRKAERGSKGEGDKEDASQEDVGVERLSIPLHKLKIVAGKTSKLRAELARQLGVSIRLDSTGRRGQKNQSTESGKSSDVAHQMDDGKETPRAESESEEDEHSGDVQDESGETSHLPEKSRGIVISGRAEDVRTAAATIKKYLEEENCSGKQSGKEIKTRKAHIRKGSANSKGDGAAKKPRGRGRSHSAAAKGKHFVPQVKEGGEVAGVSAPSPATAPVE